MECNVKLLFWRQICCHKLCLFTAQLCASRHVTCLRPPQWRPSGGFWKRRNITPLFTLQQMCHLVYLKGASDVTKSQNWKAGQLTRRFRSSVFCGREQLPFGRAFGILTLKRYTTHWMEERQNKLDISPLTYHDTCHHTNHPDIQMFFVFVFFKIVSWTKELNASCAQ